MNKIRIILVLSVVFSFSFFNQVNAQELKVKSFKADMTMTDAAKNPKKDANGVNCGLIKIGLVLPDAEFEGDVIASEYANGEWLVYMMKDANWLTIKSKKYPPLRYEFEGIQSNVTYVMEVDKPLVAYTGPTGTVKIECNVKDADVYIDGEKMSSVTPYDYKGPEGKHDVEIRSSGYNTERVTINVELNKKLSRTVTLRPRGSFQLDGISYEMVKVKGGTFIMGSDAKPENKDLPLNFAQPKHEVVLRDYSIGKTEVSQALWEKVMGSNPSVNVDPSAPVENVTYSDCLEFIKKLNKMSGQEFRLPTEAEWEYAAREGGKMRPDTYNDETARTKSIHAVGGKKPNALGLCDMSGNVAEWCSDWIAAYPSGRVVAPQGPDSGTQRVVRGGHACGNIWYLYTTSRGHHNPEEPSKYIGLRLAMDD